MLIYYLSIIETATDKNKFEELYKTYSTQMKYIALGILKNDALAEEAVHDTFMQIIENIERVDELHSERTKAFIIVMTRNISHNVFRKEKSQSRADIDEIADVQAQSNTFKSAYVDSLLEKIKQLPEIYRDTLELKVYYGMSDKQIAKATGTTESTVRKRLERARNLLK